MHLLNLSGRLALALGEKDGHALDVERASQGRYGPDPQSVYLHWEEFRTWADDASTRLRSGSHGFDDSSVVSVDDAAIEAPVPRPGQVFAIGLNYREHAEEAGLEFPQHPVVFTKFPASITGPRGQIALPSDSVDFEVELVAVIGRTTSNVQVEEGWSHIAGLTVGQDLSDRKLQLAGPAPQQFNMGKSYTGFAPIGPTLVTPDEFDNPDDVEIGCRLGGTPMQKIRTSDMIFSIPQIIAFLSSVLSLWPGDLVFTGTPSGTGWGQEPKRLIGPDDVLVTTAEGIGEMRHTFVRT